MSQCPSLARRIVLCSRRHVSAICGIYPFLALMLVERLTCSFGLHRCGYVGEGAYACGFATATSCTWCGCCKCTLAATMIHLFASMTYSRGIPGLEEVHPSSIVLEFVTEYMHEQRRKDYLSAMGMDLPQFRRTNARNSGSIVRLNTWRILL